MEHKDVFLDKHCALTKQDGFVLHGTVLEILEKGLVFQTDKKTSFINWSDVQQLLIEEDY